MSEAIDELMNEHRLIEKVLDSLEGYVGEIEAGATVDRKTVGEFAVFFREFADRCHHGKEEDRLFVAMQAHGFPAHAGPLAVMLAEHVEGRRHVGALRDLGQGSGPVSPEERRAVIDHASAFIPMLRAHIQKEDNVLYPMAMRAVPPDVMDGLKAQFEAFEKEVVGAGAHERLHALAHSLIAAHRPRA
jgi:hemerythrin-like domain-containing protein